MRIVIVTDSLGCPRGEVPVNLTYIDRLMERFPDVIFYPICQYGLTAMKFPYDYVRSLKPDLLICQFGIVDACRRALRYKEEAFISKYFPERAIKRIRLFISKHHHTITKIRRIHYCNLNSFSEAVRRINSTYSCTICYVEIALPGKELLRKTYRVIEDVTEYNKVFRNNENSNTRIISPLPSDDVDEYLLDDGHHLNERGEDMYYNSISSFIEEFLNNRNM